MNGLMVKVAVCLSVLFGFATSSTPALSLRSSAAPAIATATSQKQPPEKQTPETETVYVTKTGKKYHRAGCRSLAKSAIAMKLKDAAKSYSPCKVCKPPTI
jgi:hypothetical protein